MRDGLASVDLMTNHSSIYGPDTVCTNERQYMRGVSAQLCSTNRTLDLDMERHSVLPTARRDGPSLSGNFLSAGITGSLPGTTRVIFKRDSKGKSYCPSQDQVGAFVIIRLYDTSTGCGNCGDYSSR